MLLPFNLLHGVTAEPWSCGRSVPDVELVQSLFQDEAK